MLSEPISALYVQAYRQGASYDPSRGNSSAWPLMLARSRAIEFYMLEGDGHVSEMVLQESDYYRVAGEMVQRPLTRKAGARSS